MAGKFSQKNRESSVDIYTLLEQRKEQQQRRPGRTPPPMPPRQSQAPRAQTPAAEQQRVSRENVAVAPVQKKSPVGTLVFYTCCLAFVFLFYSATFIGLNALRSWLVRYEAAQPTVKCQQVFEQLFDQPDWNQLYDLAQPAGTAREDFVDYVSGKVGDAALTYMETSAGLSGDKKYVVRAGEERIAVFTLEDRNKEQSGSDLPDWQLKSVEFYLQYADRYLILLEEGSTAYVNGTALGEEALVAVRTSKAREYLPTFAPVPQVHVMEVSGMVTAPVVTVTDSKGNAVEVTYDEKTATYSGLAPQPQLTQEREELALKTVETYAMYMSGKATAGQLAKYFDRNSETYEAMLEADLAWVQTGSDYTFTDESVTDYRCYGEDIFSVRVSVNLNITRKEDGTVRENVITQSLFFTPNSAGDWVCFQMTAVDCGTWSQQVKLTFTDGTQVLRSEFVDADASSVSCPAVEVPEGKTFLGWTVEDTDASGQKVLRLVFTPDAGGNAQVAAGTDLEPMTLSPLFE